MGQIKARFFSILSLKKCLTRWAAACQQFKRNIWIIKSALCFFGSPCSCIHTAHQELGVLGMYPVFQGSPEICSVTYVYLWLSLCVSCPVNLASGWWSLEKFLQRGIQTGWLPTQWTTNTVTHRKSSFSTGLMRHCCFHSHYCLSCHSVCTIAKIIDICHQAKTVHWPK